MYPDEEVSSVIRENFIPVRIHVKEQQPLFERFGAEWTPTTLILDSAGKEHHRIEGFLEAPQFRRQLLLGLAHTSRSRGDYADAEQRYRELALDDDDVAAEALYWAGVSKYKESGDNAALKETAKAFQQRFTDSSWATRSSVWLP